MADVSVSAPLESRTRLNVADRLSAIAAAMPDAIAVACPPGSSPGYRTAPRGDSSATYATITFAELDADVTRIAHGLLASGVPTGTRLALLVRPGIEFVTLVFALLRAGMVIVLIDPGLGRRNLIRCLEEVEPEGFIAASMAHAIRLLLRHKFRAARWNVTVGRRWFWGGQTLSSIRKVGDRSLLASRSSLLQTSADDPAAIIFTSGSTGPPKGVLYTHRMFDAQVAEIQSAYRIEPGGVDLACFPLFALFNSAMGVTTVLPNMDFSRPAAADPRKLIAAANDWQVIQAFASPAVWRNVSDYCAATGQRIRSLRQVFSCGAPVPANVLRTTLSCVAAGAKMHTPYGATECLPVATIEADEVVGETARLTDEGAGVCVGRKFNSIEWRIIRITDEPLATLEDAEELLPGEIGELIVRGPQVSPLYVTQPRANAQTKIADGNEFWHRTGDVGYFDGEGRFWYCGRKSQRVETKSGPLFTECVEAVFNRSPAVRRSALVGLGGAGVQAAVVCVLPSENWPPHLGRNCKLEARQLIGNHELVDRIDGIVCVPVLPVDVRHNSKILREMLRDCVSEIVCRKPMLYSDFVYRCATSPANRLETRPPFASSKE